MLSLKLSVLTGRSNSQYNEEEKESILEQISFLLYQVDNQYFNLQLNQLEKELKYHSDLIDF